MTQAWWDLILGGGAGWALGDHLWQSTLGVAIAAFFVWLAGPGRPSLRHALWLAASVKFLVPFSLLVAAGETWAPALIPVPLPVFPTATFQIVGGPFTMWAEARAGMPDDHSSAPLSLVPIAALGLWATGALALVILRSRRGQRVRSVVSAGTVLTSGREVEAVGRVLARAQSARRTVTVRLVSGVTAPALFGLRRAVLLWPAGLSARLSTDAMESIVAHEIAHFRRRDNVAALVHTLVETAFWFHPLVWWMSARLVEERERACDREALDAGVAPRTYAETLLNVCRFGLAVPQPLLSSAAGSSLGRRVEVIMSYRSRRLVAPPRGFTAALAALLILGPMAVGIGRGHARGLTLQAAEPNAMTAMVEPAPATPPVTIEAPPVNRASPPAVPPEDGRPAPRKQDYYRRGGITAVAQVQPTYTAAALQAGIEGTVELEAVVLTDGTVGDVRVVKSLDRVFGLDEQAIQAARRWVFRPPVDTAGKPVRAAVTLILDFRLAKQAAPGVGPDSAQTPASPAAPPRDPRPAPPSQQDLEFRRGALAPGTPGLTAAKTTRTIAPVYTSEAMRAKVQGSVELEAVVGPDGTVERARVTRSLHPDLDAQALSAIRQWRFEPATLDGKPVVTWMRFTMDFRLY